MTDAQTRPTTGFDWHDADCGFYEGHGFDGEPLTLPCDCGLPAAIAQVEREARQQALTDAIAAVEGLDVDDGDTMRVRTTQNLVRAAVIDTLTRLRDGS